MGHIRHHAIIVTAWDGSSAEKARNEAERLGCAVSGLVRSQVNGYETFVIAPDGSKSGWEASNDGDERRDRFTRWLAARREDEWSAFEWVEVSYGADDRSVNIERHEWVASTAETTGATEPSGERGTP